MLSLFAGVSICIEYHVTGLPCPACGLTRAFISLAGLEFGRAFIWHPLFFLLPFIPLLALENLPGGKGISLKLRSRLAFTVLGLFVFVWAVRMILLFPATPPMVYNENSLFWRLFMS